MAEKDEINNSKFTLDPYWLECEKIAMHFNDLIINIRAKGLAALSAILLLSSTYLISKSNDISINLLILSIIIFVLTLFWRFISILDTEYYSKLLTGSVEKIIQLEKNYENTVYHFSENIKKQARQAIPRRFYTSTLLVLEISSFISFLIWCNRASIKLEHQQSVFILLYFTFVLSMIIYDLFKLIIQTIIIDFNPKFFEKTVLKKSYFKLIPKLIIFFIVYYFHSGIFNKLFI